MDLTLEQIFGVGANQDANTLVIQKPGLIGLTPSSNNTPESLLAAIIATVDQQFEGWLTDPNGLPVLDQNANTVDYDNSVLYSFLGVSRWQQQPIFNGIIPYTFLIFSYSPYAN